MTRLYTRSAILLFAAVLASGCGDKAETPAAPEVETNAVVVETGAISTAVVVEKSAPESEFAFIAATELQTLEAKVVSIDPESREVVLVGEDGIEIELTASKMTRNLDQVSPGDTVNAKFMERVTIELVKGGDLKAMNVNVDESAQAEEGEMPARAAIETSVSVFTVEAIDLVANTFKLKNADGGVNQFTAQDPANLAKAAVGDAVVVTVTEALAVEVTKTIAD
jgi:hypothetical protein